MAQGGAQLSSSALLDSPVRLLTPCAVLANPVDLFSAWYAEEAEWQRAHQLAESCPVQYVCPISLEPMIDPVILAETGQCYERANIRKWFCMGGDSCPLTGVRLRSTELVTDTALQARILMWTANRFMDLSLPEAPAAQPAGCKAGSSDAVATGCESAPSEGLPLTLEQRAAREDGGSEGGGRSGDEKPGRDGSGKEWGDGHSGVGRSPGCGEHGGVREAGLVAAGLLMRVFSNAAYAWREASFAAPSLRGRGKTSAAAVPQCATAYANPTFLDLARRRRSETAARQVQAARARGMRSHSVSASGRSGFWFLSPRQRQGEAAVLGTSTLQKPPCALGAMIELLAQPAAAAGAHNAAAAGEAAIRDLCAAACSDAKPEASSNDATQSPAVSAHRHAGRPTWRAIGEALDAQVGRTLDAQVGVAQAAQEGQPAEAAEAADAEGTAAAVDSASAEIGAVERADSGADLGTGRTAYSAPSDCDDTGARMHNSGSWALLGSLRGRGELCGVPRPSGCLGGVPGGGCLLARGLLGASRLGRRAVQPSPLGHDSDEEWGLPSVREASAEIIYVSAGGKPDASPHAGPLGADVP